MDKGHLVPRSYQMYVAADLCKHISNGGKHTVMTLGAGQGKTLVYLLVALMLAKSDQTKETYKTFTVLTSSPLLEKQLKDTIRNHNIGISV